VNTSDAGAGSLSDYDRAVLRQLRVQPCRPGCRCGGTSAHLIRDYADDIRRDLPDVDDVTIARVVLATIRRAAIPTVQSGLGGPQTLGLLGGIAAEIAALEIGDPTA
jgi:hypothetical protein